MVMAQFMGLALGFIIVPYLTRHYDIHTMLYVTAEMALLSALLATIYFPPRPPTPPSPSATTDRTKFLSSLKDLMCNRAFIVLAISGGLITGANRFVVVTLSWIPKLEKGSLGTRLTFPLSRNYWRCMRL